jgi:hypothetical protein
MTRFSRLWREALALSAVALLLSGAPKAGVAADAGSPAASGGNAAPPTPQTAPPGNAEPPAGVAAPANSAPAAQPAAPVAQPAAPVAQPAAPVAQPAAPAAQPAAPVAQLAAPVAQPAAPVAQPAAPAKPVASVAPPPSPNLEPLTDHDCTGVLGKKVIGPDGKELGLIVDVLVDAHGRPHAAIIDFGGFLGVGSRKIAVDWRLLKPTPGQPDWKLSLNLDRAEIQGAPEYKPGAPADKMVGPPATASPAPHAGQ